MTRDEVVALLKRGAEYADLVSLRDGGRKNKTMLSQHFVKKCEEMEAAAAAVDAMRCETCTWKSRRDYECPYHAAGCKGCWEWQKEEGKER